MKKSFYLLFFLLLGCESFQPSVQVLPSHIKKIAIQQFVNKTNIYGLEERLKLNTINEFLLDGRFEVVSEMSQSDGYITGEILYYILQPTAYGTNYEVQQYKLRLIVNFYFVDVIKNVTLWEEPNIEEVLYFSAATLPGGLTEEEAKNTILSNMAKKIYIRTIEGFGSVTGTSYKKVPQK
ncbi:MAG: LPS assembly lipoprotein LptE [Endomicrobiia bacterium]